MKILYDHQTFSQQDYGGISLYFCEIMNQFSKDPTLDFTLSLRYSQNENMRRSIHLNKYWSNKNDFFSDNLFFSKFQKKIGFNLLNYIFNNKRESELLLKKQDFDVFHPTYYDPYFLKHLRKKPYILTVHDMIHELFPQYFSLHDPVIQWKKQLVENSQCIIAVSESTKRDILKFFKIDSDRIRVIYHGNPFQRTPDMSQMNKYRYPKLFSEKYFLFVGTRLGYKNFLFFIRSVKTILVKYDDIHIYCAGGGPFTFQEKEILKELNVINKVHYIQIDDLSIQNFYKNAYAFIFPSLYEGFGLPILEAFSCGCPAILSNTSSLPEIGGPAAIYFDPYDSESISNAIERIINDDNLRAQMIRKGYEHVKLFSWEKTAIATKTIYEKVIEKQ